MQINSIATADIKESHTVVHVEQHGQYEVSALIRVGELGMEHQVLRFLAFEQSREGGGGYLPL